MYGYHLAAAAKSLQLYLTLCDPMDVSPPRLPHPWDSPGNNTGVGCHFLLQCTKVKSESEVAQSCLRINFGVYIKSQEESHHFICRKSLFPRL